MLYFRAAFLLTSNEQHEPLLTQSLHDVYACMDMTVCMCMCMSAVKRPILAFACMRMCMNMHSIERLTLAYSRVLTRVIANTIAHCACMGAHVRVGHRATDP